MKIKQLSMRKKESLTINATQRQESFFFPRQESGLHSSYILCCKSIQNYGILGLLQCLIFFFFLPKMEWCPCDVKCNKVACVQTPAEKLLHVSPLHL